LRSAENFFGFRINMKKFPTQRNSLTAVAATVLAVTLGAAHIARAVLPAPPSTIANVDVRTSAAHRSAPSASRDAGASKLKQSVPGVEVTYDSLLGTPKFVRTRDGFLTGPDGTGRGVTALAKSSAYRGEADRPVKLFLDEHAGLFGFGAESLASAQKTRDAVGSHNGLRTIVWEQQLNGVPVFESKLVANITKLGELVNVSSRFVPALTGTASRAADSTIPALTANQAIASALTGLGEAGEAVVSATTPPGSPYEKFAVGSRSAHARLVFLPMDARTVRLAYEVYVNSLITHQGFQVLVDANTGETLVRKNLTRHISDATYNIYPSDSPSPFSPGWPTPNSGQPPLVNRTLVTTNAFSVLASPNGWINDGDNETRGNNADAYVDRNFDFQPDGPRPQGNPTRVFDFPLDLTQDPLTYSNAAVVQMFYKVNVYHDQLYELGFTEAFGNYQLNNLGRGGIGNDEVLCYVQAGADVGAADNAFFIPAPDGINGQIAMFVWDFPNPQRDGDLDSEVIFHEASHGTSWRLVGGGMGLGNLQGDGMGEGWSDFYAGSLLAEPTDDPDATYAFGGYPTYLFVGLTENYYYGIRHFPWSTDMTKNPFTYKDIDPTQISAHAGVPRSPLYPFDPSEASEVHHQGEVWAAMLWDVRANLVHKYGFAGNQIMLQLVTDGMKITPATPTFVEARDAILLADQINNGGANVNEIWRGFAKRGLGVGATSPDPDTTTGVVESYSIPGLQFVGVDVTGGNGNAMIDPNECNDLFITLTNASGAAATSVKVTLASSTPGVYVTVPSVTIPVFPADTIISNIGPFRVSTIPEFICGTPVSFTLGVKSEQGVNTNQFTLATGALGTPVRFDSQVPVAIPDLSAIVSPINVTNINGALGKVTVALYLTHTFDSDLTLELISPDGTTNILASHVGSSSDNFGSGCSPDGFRTTFDDDAATSIVGGAPPFVGAFRPQFPLSVFNAKYGTNVNGTWQLRVIDSVGGDFGILQCWSLYLSPADCIDGGGSCPGTDLALAMADAPDPVVKGSNLVYTLTVTNVGPNTAKGTVLTHNLPASTIFVSATTTRGSVSQTAGVVTANLGNMTIGATATVTVTVIPGQTGPIISSAIVSSTEPEINPPNNVASVTTLVQDPTADLAVSLAGAPNPAVVGGTLTYTATVLNNGPSTATGVVITNTLPASVLITGASSTQGSVSISGNIVICQVGNLVNGATATATINTVPLADGTIFANARVVGNLVDPVLANNTATIATGVGKAADLGITIEDQPDPVVVNSNYTYLVTVTNRGPNQASSVVVNQLLPASLTVVGSNVSQGSIVIGGGTAVWSVGSVPVGGIATMSIVGKSAVTGTNLSTASVNGSETDPNLADNTAGASTLIATPFVSIVGAGVSLKSESIAPANGAVDAGEMVTIEFRLRNAGNIPNTNVVATLLATGGVTSPSGAQTYGVLPPGGLPVGTNFTFTANGTNGGTITATLQVTDGGNFLTNVSFVLTLPRQFNFTNGAAITIPSVGNAAPYPSTIVVSGVTGTVGQVTATLNNLNHTFAPDVDVLLVGPLGQKVILMGSAGGAAGVANATVTFSDTAAQAIPQNSQISSGSYQPANYAPSPNFPAPAPSSPYASGLSAFANLIPNGTWSLYIVDHATGDAGNVASGWSLGISVITPVNSIADLSVAGAASPSIGLVGDSSVWTVTVTNRGPNVANGVVVTNTLSAGLVLQSASSTQGVTSTNGGVVITSVGGLSTNGTATITIVAKATSVGAASVTAKVATSDIDLNSANNMAVIAANNSLPVADLSLGIIATPVSGITGSNLTLTVSATNAGPGKALASVVTVPLAAGLSYQSSSASKGSAALNAGSVVCSFGDLLSNETVTASIIVTPQFAATLTNFATAATQSTDGNTTNNQASVVVVVSNPRPIIVASGTTMVAETSPANGAVDAGETVTIAFALANTGQLPTTSLNAVLLATGGVGSPSGSQNYGVLASGGAAVARNFTFTAPNTPGGTVTATLQLDDNGSPLGSVSFVFGLPRSTNFANTTPITIPDHGTASPYPSIITVSGVTGVVGKVTVTLNGFSHSFPSDVDALLVGPQGQKLMVMSDAGGGISVSNLNFGFDDSAAAALPAATVLGSGTFKPTDHETGDVLPAPAPTGERSSQLSAYNGTDPNGNWSLYVADDSTGDAGLIAGGWALSFTTIEPISPLANVGIVSASGSPGEILTGELVTYQIQITNRGPADATGVTVTDTLPIGASLDSASASQGSYSSGAGVVTFSLGTVPTGAGAGVTVIVRHTKVGNALNSVAVVSTQTDLDSSDNSAGIATLVTSGVAAQLEGIYDEPNQMFDINLTGQANATYILQRSTDLITWDPVATNTASAGGTIKFSDPASAAITQRFYRALLSLP
jgi:uncharacterized repeat protein (TIGR01451 family)